MTQQTPLERAARAIAEAGGVDADSHWQYHLSEARTVLASLLPPDEGTVEAGWAALDADDGEGVAPGARAAFTAMITHVLEAG